MMRTLRCRSLGKNMRLEAGEGMHHLMTMGGFSSSGLGGGTI